MLFISETRIQDKKEKYQKPKIQIEGFTFVLKNTPTEAGGTAIYVSNTLQYNERKDIKFEFPNCEACFIDIECEHLNTNPIFGALYRHPDKKFAHVQYLPGRISRTVHGTENQIDHLRRYQYQP